MTENKFRQSDGGLIEREQPLDFTFDGVSYRGYQGDTLASALLANGVHLVGRSFKYHRPRGILSAGWEEPNALVQLEDGPYTQPNSVATTTELYANLKADAQNVWPSLKYDVGALNSLFSRLFVAGFYYKTFKWPRKAWEAVYERTIRRAAGMGKAPTLPDPDRYEHQYAHADVLIVGAGAAGLAAAVNAARSGARILLIDDDAQLGGRLLGQPASIDGQAGVDWARQQEAVLAEQPNVKILKRTQVTGNYDYNYLIALERVTDHLGPGCGGESPRQRLWKIRAKQVILATGACERPLVFADNDRPGIMLASAVGTYLQRYAVLVGRKIVFFTNNDSVYPIAQSVRKAGADVEILDLREHVESAQIQAALDDGIQIQFGTAITAVQYTVRRGIESLTVHKLNAAGDAIIGAGKHLRADIVAMSGGWSPAVHLHCQGRGKLVWREAQTMFVPGSIGPTHAQCSIGACNGELSLQAALDAGAKAAQTVTQALGKTVDLARYAVEGAMTDPLGDLRPVWLVPTDHPVGQGKKKHFHEFQNDATAADVQLAQREGFESIEHLKRYTNTGRGTDQGKLSNVTGLALMAQARGLDIPSVGFTTYRAPYTALAFGAVTGQAHGSTFTPERKTPMHALHETAGAVFENVGDWWRARYYPLYGEDMDAAVARECLAVRSKVGLLDASTLGKIDIQGPDARRLLNMVYTNKWNKLAPGKCRYGVMVNEHGMVFDDGVTTCLDDQHFHMTTTTGGAARVLDWLEEWLQTEWPDWEVYCTSVTEQWAVLSLNGPRARDVLKQLTDMDLDPAAFPFMSMREGQVAGVPARVYRISFTGELAYEINVPAAYGKYVWEQVMQAGADQGICAYGTEAMHVLRAEKGFIIVGQDSDGTLTPDDLGMSWIVADKPDGLGRRSWKRSDTAREGRKQLVGLLTEDATVVLPEGAHIVTQVKPKPPMEMIGHVTSSYMSAICGHAIAMALVKDGFARMGDSVDVALMHGGSVKAKIVSPVFYDEQSERARA